MIVMVFYNGTPSWVGGNGCTTFLLLRTSSTVSWVKVSLHCVPLSPTLTRRRLALGHTLITCAPAELVTIEPPTGMSCSAYMDPYISIAGGYLTNPNAAAECLFCPFRTTDEFLELSFNISYEHHWRDLGVVLGFGVINVRLVCLSFLFLFSLCELNGD